jgi:hypothetical protein
MAMVIVGLMRDPHEARGAVRALREAGFTFEDLDTQGGLADCLSELGVPEGEVAVFAEGVRRGGTMIGVLADNEEEAENAAHIMSEHGAVDLGACAQSWSAAEETELLFGEQPSAPGRMYRDSRARGYEGPNRRTRDRPYEGLNRRAM